MRHRSGARPRRSIMRRNWRWPRPASTRSSRSPACRRSTISPISPMPASALSYSNRGASEASGRGPTSCRSPSTCRTALNAAPDGRLFVLAPPPIQGIGNAGGFQMQTELLGGSFDYQKLSDVGRAACQSGQRRSRLAARPDDVPPRCAAGFGDRRPRPGRDLARLGRRCVLRAERPISARLTSTSSTNSVSHCRSTSRPTRSFG